MDGTYSFHLSAMSTSIWYVYVLQPGMSLAVALSAGEMQGRPGGGRKWDGKRTENCRRFCGL
jgi:hypothetical protein